MIRDVDVADRGNIDQVLYPIKKLFVSNGKIEDDI